MATMDTPAASLMGLELKDDWVVVERLDPGVSSGGYFSEQYLVRRPNGTEAFLKALDFSPAAGAGLGRGPPRVDRGVCVRT